MTDSQDSVDPGDAHAEQGVRDRHLACAEARVRRRRVAWAVGGALGAGLLLAGAWPVLVATATEQEPCSRALLSRVQSGPVFTPFDDDAFLRGEAEYSGEVKVRNAARTKVHMRSERRYRGPVPRGAELACFLDHGLADAFYPLLKAPHRAAIAQELRVVDQELAALAQEIDLETEHATLAVGGSSDEIRIPHSGPQWQVRQRDLADKRIKADKSKELYFHASRSSEEVYFRVTRERFPRLFELMAAQSETGVVRHHILQESARKLLLTEGVAALDGTRFDAGGRR